MVSRLQDIPNVLYMAKVTDKATTEQVCLRLVECITVIMLESTRKKAKRGRKARRGGGSGT